MVTGPPSRRLGAVAMIEDLVVNLSLGKQRDVAGEFALSVAATFDAHVSAVAFAYEPPIGGSVFDGMVPSVIDSWRAERESEAKQARESFEGRARIGKIKVDSRIISDGSTNAAQVFAALARNYDIAVVAQPEPKTDLPESLIVEAALFDSGRPILVVPYIQDGGLKLDRVAVCWDGSRNAARAIGDAMPLLARAGKIDVITVAQKERRDQLPGTLIATHLARHNLKVELKPIVAADSDAANVILSYAADNEIDLIVMGGYGHTRLREFILGGATRGLLETMTVPTLMAH